MGIQVSEVETAQEARAIAAALSGHRDTACSTPPTVAAGKRSDRSTAAVLSWFTSGG